MTPVEWNIIVGLVCTVLGAVIGYASFSRSKEKDDKTEGQQAGAMLTELGYIKGSVDNINKKMDKQEERNLELVERISSVEASAKQAHKRLDRLEGREDLEHESH